MKVMIRKKSEGYEAYVPKKDMEEMVVEMENDGLWGGWAKLANGWVFQMPEMAADTRLPITVEARKISSGEE
ncbi:putative nitrogen fixation protein NifT [Rhodospirillum sp. A1_3_36]|uniref:putative nitrogen fixation protein NifT n=1 Tax=Rhodospirillum sp. A1_3_36 TaxID=3391666 RepID=UPI0039A733AF